MSTAIQATNRKDIRALLQSESVQSQVAKVLPKFLTPDAFLRVALTTYNTTPKLAQCTPESLLSRLMQCAQYGLVPDGRHAHLIPFGQEVQLIFDYKGLVYLAQKNGIANIRAQVVCENDKFAHEIVNGDVTLRHRIEWTKPRGHIVAVYVTCKFEGETDCEVMSREEVESIRTRSKAAKSGPWVTDFGEMYKKTVIRRMSKRWPLLPEFAGAFADGDDDTVSHSQVEIKAPTFGERPTQALAEMLFTPPAALAAPTDTKPEDDMPYDEPPQQSPPEPKPEPNKPADPQGQRELLSALMKNSGVSYDQLQAVAIREDLWAGADTWDSVDSMPEAALSKAVKHWKAIRAQIEQNGGAK